jgi:hypothetical protein
VNSPRFIQKTWASYLFQSSSQSQNGFVYQGLMSIGAPGGILPKKGFFGSLFAKFPCSGQQEFARFKMPFCLRLLPPEPQICAAIICLKCLISAAGPRGAPARREVRWPDHFLTTRYFFSLLRGDGKALRKRWDSPSLGSGPLEAASPVDFRKRVPPRVAN